LPKNESCQDCVLTIPLCRGERDEATGENDIEIGPRTCPHAPTRWLSTRADAPQASSSPGWADPTRIWWRQHDVIMTLACTVSLPRMTSAWCNGDVTMHSRHAMSAPSHLTHQHRGTHQSCHQPRAELSWSRASSRGIGFSVADPTWNRIWDWIWAAHQARMFLIKS
jgi:hypothetical protein